MENTNEYLIETLNDLIKINNDRIAGYEKAIDSLKDLDSDLKAVYASLALQSRTFIERLMEETKRLGGKVTNDSTLSGKVYRLWMGLKASFSGHDRQSSLEACEFGEDAAQRAYTNILFGDIPLENNIHNMLLSQKEKLKEAHDLIKNYRDGVAA